MAYIDQSMRAGLMIGLLLLGGAGAVSPLVAGAQQNVQTADAVCGSCHAGIYRSYLATPKANASGMAADRLIPGEFTHAPSSVHYEVAGDGRQATLHFADRRNAHEERSAGEHRLDYFLGSGHLGVTYLYTQEGYLLESPVAWYAARQGYDMKPGYGALTEMPPALPMEPTCLRCHMSGVAHAVPGSINRYSGLPFQQTGITCEACHGSGVDHVRSGGKTAVLDPAKLDAERRDSVCMSCHLEGDVSVERRGRSALDYRPGDRLGDYLSYFVFANKDPLMRGVSEVEQFSVSQCKQASGDGMSCTSCHDPHASPAPEQKVAFYRGKCLTCHSAPAFASAHHPENPDCTSCHMPRSGAQNIPHVAWTDHRILRFPEVAPGLAAGSGALAGSGASADSSKSSTLVAVLSARATERDLAVAKYKAIVRGSSRDREAAIAALRQLPSDRAPDPQVLEALGVLTGLGNEPAASEAYLRELVRVDPLNLTGIADLGVLLARQGKLQEAMDLWKPAFAGNQDLIGLARNLAATQCALGDEAGARRTVETALAFSPGVRALWTFACKR